MDDQMTLFNLDAFTRSDNQPIYDPFWNEDTEDSQQSLLMVVEDDELETTTISKRSLGEGTGRITKRTISKNGKNYHQYWYDWQYYENGRLVGRSKYIPKRLLFQIQEMEKRKLPVNQILQLLSEYKKHPLLANGC